MTFRVLWLSLKDLFDELFLMILVNIIWLLISAPLIVVAGMLFINGSLLLGSLAALLAVVPMGPATGGIYTIAERVTEGRVASWRVFFEGFREYARLSWQLYGLWMLGLLAILVNLQFYGQVTSSLGLFLNIIFLYILLIWCALLIYIGPLMLIQRDKRIRVIARNAFFMALGRPIFTLITLILMAAILVLSIWLGFLGLLLTFGFLAIWSFRATTAVIADAEARRVAEQERAAVAASRSGSEKGRGGQIRPRE